MWVFCGILNHFELTGMFINTFTLNCKCNECDSVFSILISSTGTEILKNMTDENSLEKVYAWKFHKNSENLENFVI